MFTGLAVIILFKTGAFNLSMEGAFFIGAVAACAASLGLGLSGKTALIVAMAAAAVAGGFICFIPGIMKVKTGSNELVTSLMLNYTCLYVGLWIITTFFYDPTQNSNYSYKFPEGCALSKIITGTRINSGTIIALVTVLVIWVTVNRTPFGFKANLVGENLIMKLRGHQLRPHNHPDPDSGWYAGGTRRRCGAFRHVPALPVFRTPGLWLGPVF